jgi:hypothetical protein
MCITRLLLHYNVYLTLILYYTILTPFSFYSILNPLLLLFYNMDSIYTVLASANDIQNCVQKASTPSNTINQLIQQEMAGFQDRCDLLNPSIVYLTPSLYATALCIQICYYVYLNMLLCVFNPLYATPYAIMCIL